MVNSVVLGYYFVVCFILVWVLCSVGFCVLRFCCALCCDCCDSLAFGLLGLGVVALRLLFGLSLWVVVLWYCVGMLCELVWARFSGYLGSCVLCWRKIVVLMLVMRCWGFGSVVWYLSCTAAEFGYLRLGCVLLRVF